MNIYLDCGFYAGMVLKRLITDGTIDKTWTIYAFDPNPELPSRVKDFAPIKYNLAHKAVWVEDGEVEFHIAGREDAAGIANLTGHTDPKIINVPSIDFSKFVAGLPKDARILCSMDIEGAEFAVLNKMLADGTMGRIEWLEIDFHHRFMLSHTAEDAQNLVNAMQALGTKVELRVPLV